MAFSDERLQSEAEGCRDFFESVGATVGPVKAHFSSASGFNRLTGSVLVEESKRNTELERYETLAHEIAHQFTDKKAGWGGFFYAGPSGALAEGLAETFSAIAVADRFGEDVGIARLDPEGKSLPMFGFGNVSIPVHQNEVSWKYLDDLGGVHLNNGVMRKAHANLARSIGMGAMTGLVLDALDHLKPWSGVHSFADAQMSEAQKDDDPLLAQQVRSAWEKVGIGV